jgi:uncharacterized protein DUF3592
MEVLFLWVGLLFITIGALVIHAEARARRAGVAVAGRIVGFSRPKADTDAPYHAVAEFISQDGQSRLIESAVGSSAPIGRVGDAVSILIRPGEPESAVFKSPATYFIGSILALLGAVCCWVFLTTFRANLFSIATSAAVTTFVAYKLHRLWRNQPISLGAWRALKDKALRGRVIAAESRDQIVWTDTASLEKVISRQERMNRYARPLLVLGGAGLMILGLYLYRSTDAFLARAIRAPGRVVELAASDSSDDVTYAPVVEFEGHGERQRFKDSISSNPPSYRTGDAVQVLYDPGDPRRARIDRGLWNRAIPVLVGAFGALLSLCGLWIRPRGSQSSTPVTTF